jgi:hypothetical protein
MATEDIKKALAELDSGNDAHWTDDGLPRIDVIQTLLKDPAVRRKDINEASPGFSRASEKTTEPEDVQEGDPVEVTVIAAEAPEGADLEHNDGLNLDERDPLSDIARLDPVELKTLMSERITAAALRLDQARAAVRDAVAYEKKCTFWADKAKLDFNRKFPPLHPSDAIKQHLQSQLDQRYIAAGQVPPGARPAPASPLDAVMGLRKRQGRVYAPAVAAH